MIAVSFGDCTGFLHDASGDIGVVLCAPQGFEALCSRRDWRVLAEDIAGQGLPVVRFDYPGTGDALGCDTDPDRIDAWVGGIIAAVTFMRETVGTQRIVLVGLRLGAALAALAALGQVDIVGFVALNPVVNGKAYVREMDAMSRVNAPPQELPKLHDGIAVAGFRLTAATLSTLKALDLRLQPIAPAPHCLICAPEGTAAATSLASHWQGLGSVVTTANFPFYAEWMGDSTLSRRPAEAMAQVLDWLASNILPRAGVRSAPLGLLPAPRCVGETFIEEPVWFGAQDHLFGVLCQPKQPMTNSLTLVFLNTGRNYHVGWARNSVKMAREMAAVGVPSLRIDVAGLGDSPDVAGRNREVLYSKDTIADLGVAIDALEARSLTRVCVVGFCTGAHLGFHAALHDKRITHLIMVNLQRFIWKDSDSLEIAMRESFRATHYYQRNLWRAQTWVRLLRGDLNLAGIARQLLRRLTRKTAALQVGGDGAQVRAGMRALAQRGTQTLLVYSDNDAGLDELALHLGAGKHPLSKYPGVRLAVITGADHNFTPDAARQQFTDLLAPHLLSAAPGVR